MKPKKKLETMILDIRGMVINYGKNYDGGHNIDETQGVQTACADIDEMLKTFDYTKYL